MERVAAESLEAIELLKEALIGPDMAELVEMTVHSPAPGEFRATAVDGSVTFRRRAIARTWTYEVLEVSGRNPLADQTSDRFVGHLAERDAVFPTRVQNSYPHAFDSIAQFFDSDVSPDLLVTHTAAHHVDGYLGQHGSLGAVQARAPFLASGAGIKALGTIERSTRVVNIAPTIAALMGLDEHPAGRSATGEPTDDALLERQDGTPELEILDGTEARHVVVFLLDGCNANLLAEVIDSGEAPNLRALLDDGTMFGHGSMASLPTATLANHTTAITGAHPGHSGILHNAWVDRGTGSSTNLLSIEEMFTASQYLAPGIETIFEAVTRSRPGSFNAATFEYCDRGAAFSSFALVRSGEQTTLPDFEAVDHVAPDHDDFGDLYGFISRVDHQSVAHTLECWRREHGNELPALTWCSLALTDEAGHHSGPHGAAARAAVRDSDARIGEVLTAIDAAGVRDRTAVLVIADHGMEQADPGVDQTWDDALTTTGVGYSEVGGGLIYLNGR
jgi:predicted AlkP superfamily pyrophosphatase or phosphodiesterase